MIEYPCSSCGVCEFNIAVSRLTLATAIKTGATTLGLTLTVTGVTAQPIVKTAGGGTTLAPQASATAGSRDRDFNISYLLSPPDKKDMCNL
jgi:hypothetical protein